MEYIQTLGAKASLHRRVDQFQYFDFKIVSSYCICVKKGICLSAHVLCMYMFCYYLAFA